MSPIDNSSWRFASNYKVFPIYLIWLACIFDPIGNFYAIKYVAIFLALLVILCGFRKIPIGGDFYSLSLLFFVFVIPADGLLISFLRGGIKGDFIDTSYLVSSLYFLLTLIFFDRDNVRLAVNGLLFSLRCLCVAIIFLFSLTGTQYFGDVANFFIVNGMAFVGVRMYGGISFPYLYFIVSPMIVFLVAYQVWLFLGNKSMVRALLVVFPVIAMVLTGTRANMFASVIGVFFIVGWYYFRVKSLLFYPLFLCVVIGILAAFESQVIDGMLSTSDRSNSMKISYLSFYADAFDSVSVFIFGQGLNAQAWSFDFSNILSHGASKVELTYIEFIRVFGFFLFLPFLVILSCISFTSESTNKLADWYFPACFLYLAISFSNPYIFSMNGILIIGLGCILANKKLSRIRVSDSNDLARLH